VLRAGQVDVWVVPLDEPPARIERLRRTLSPDEVARSETFRFPEGRDSFIVARGTLRAALGRYLQSDPKSLRFTYSKHGKPALHAACGGGALRFNVSHSHRLALLAVTREREIGVDLEVVRSDLDGEALARAFFSEREVEALLRINPEQRSEAFYRCWTCKEAYLKAIGQGLSVPLKQFSVAVDPNAPAALLKTPTLPASPASFTIHVLATASGYAAALALEGHPERIRILGAANRPSGNETFPHRMDTLR
jgi:4'-phosphopantetheinyl transferase